MKKKIKNNVAVNSEKVPYSKVACLKENKMIDLIKILPEAEKGSAKIEHYTVTEQESRMSSLRPGEYCPEGTYVVLKVNGETVMSNTRMERNTNRNFIQEAYGNVLIAGLGIGYILSEILKKPEISSVQVVELSSDVIHLVAPSFRNLFPDKLKIDRGDIFSWFPYPEDQKYDTIYFDIWSNSCEDYRKEVKRLKQIWRPYLEKDKTKKPWIGDWNSEALKWC